MTDFKYPIFSNVHPMDSIKQLPTASDNYSPSLQSTLDALKDFSEEKKKLNQKIHQLGAAWITSDNLAEAADREKERRINENLQALEKEQKEEAEAEIGALRFDPCDAYDFRKPTVAKSTYQKPNREAKLVFLKDGTRYVLTNYNELYAEFCGDGCGWLKIPRCDYVELPQDSV